MVSTHFVVLFAYIHLIIVSMRPRRSLLSPRLILAQKLHKHFLIEDYTSSLSYLIPSEIFRCVLVKVTFWLATMKASICILNRLAIRRVAMELKIAHRWPVIKNEISFPLRLEINSVKFRSFRDVFDKLFISNATNNRMK